MLQVGVSAAVMGRNRLIVNMMLTALKEKTLRSDLLRMCKLTWHATTPPPTVVDLPYPLPLRELQQEHGGTPDLIQRYLKANTEVVPLDK